MCASVVALPIVWWIVVHSQMVTVVRKISVVLDQVLKQDAVPVSSDLLDGSRL